MVSIQIEVIILLDGGLQYLIIIKSIYKAVRQI